MIRNGGIGLLVVCALLGGVTAGWGQDRPDTRLRSDVERRFEVLPLREGIALRPRGANPGVRLIEMAGDAIALDGVPATGAEVRARLGGDADVILRLSYLSETDRRALFALSPAAPPPVVPSPPSVTAPPPPAPPEPPAPPRPERRRDTSGDRVRIGGSVDVAEGETIEGDVVAVGGSVNVDGEVLGDVVAVAGSVKLGPHADVGRNVVSVGGAIARDPQAQVGGKLSQIGITGLEFGDWSWRRNPVGTWWGAMVGSAFALVGTLARVAVLCLLTALVVLFGRDYMERAGNVAQRQSVKAGLVGFLAQLLFVPLLVITIVVLVLTIVGIPFLLLLPFAILLVAVFGLIGFTAVAHLVGSAATRRLGWSTDNPYLVTVTGVLLLMAPVILSRLIGLGGGGPLFPITLSLGIAGALIEYLAWTVGFGAVALARFRPRGAVPVA